MPRPQLSGSESLFSPLKKLHPLLHSVFIKWASNFSHLAYETAINVSGVRTPIKMISDAKKMFSLQSIFIFLP